jgi:hypothetical protein
MVPTGDDIINVPKFIVKELMDLLADDTDGDDLGMAVVGVTSNKIGTIYRLYDNLNFINQYFLL